MPQPHVADPSKLNSLIKLLVHDIYLFSADTQFLINTAVDASRAARSHAMDARMSKQPTGQLLHTTAGLTAAKSSMGDGNIFISAQCRIKSTSAKDQKNTDPSCGQWGKPWPKDAYMSGQFSSFVLCVLYI
jgi:hypothetical protein